MNRQVAGVFDDHQVMTITLMITKKEVLAMSRHNIFPVPAGLPDSCNCGMFVIVIRNLKFFKKTIKPGITVHIYQI
jgi:hypothetical protein